MFLLLVFTFLVHQAMVLHIEPFFWSDCWLIAPIALFVNCVFVQYIGLCEYI